MLILIATPSLVPNDAVSNDVLQQFKCLSAKGFSVKLFSEHCHDSLKSQVVSKLEFELELKDPANILIYHHSVFWALADDFLNASKCKIMLKYHNITPSHYFDYDSHRVFLTTEGRKQTARFVHSGKVGLFVGDSQYNSEEMIQAGAPRSKTRVIPPFHRIHDFDGIKPDSNLLNSLRKDVKHVLFVGRVAPNKGHLHLIRTLEKYVEFFGRDIHLHVVGGVSPGDGHYLEKIENEVSQLKVNELISFHNKITFDQLCAFYAGSDAFLLMSEHEGFCVPILEAQYHSLPLVAWNQTAVGETIGEGQLILSELNYEVFAVALNRVFNDLELEKNLTASGKINFAKFETPRLLDLTLEALHAINS